MATVRPASRIARKSGSCAAQNIRRGAGGNPSSSTGELLLSPHQRDQSGEVVSRGRSATCLRRLASSSEIETSEAIESYETAAGAAAPSRERCSLVGGEFLKSVRTDDRARRAGQTAFATAGNGNFDIETADKARRPLHQHDG